MCSAQITSKNTDDTQTRQNTGNLPECCKTKQELRITNKWEQIQTRQIHNTSLVGAGAGTLSELEAGQPLTNCFKTWAGVSNPVELEADLIWSTS